MAYSVVLLHISAHDSLKRDPSGRLRELRRPLASEADTDYNMQFDPKSQVLSSHTSPGNTTPTVRSALCAKSCSAECGMQMV